MDRVDRMERMDRMERGGRQKEPATLALRLKPYKAAIQQLRSVLRTLKENTTVSFLPTPSMILQTVRLNHVSKITFNSSCLYVTDRNFQSKTINNVIPMIGNFMYMTSSKDLTKFYVQDVSDLSAKVHMSAPDFTMDFTSACVHGQDIVRENGESSSRVDLDFHVVSDLIKWLVPHTRAKRNVKRQSPVGGSVHVLMHANPPTLKFSLSNTSELEFTASNKVSFHEVKNMRITLSAKNLHQALVNCAVTKLQCTFRILADHEVMLYVSSKNSAFSVENFLSEEQFTRGDLGFERSSGGGSGGGGGGSGGHGHRSGGGSVNSGCGAQMNDANENSEDAGPEMHVKKHDRSGNRKGDPDHGGSRDKYDQHKITNYMVSKSGGSGERGGSYFGDAKEESDSDDDESVNFEFVPSAKKQKC